MTRHFAYLIACDVRNRLRRQLSRMRSPRYAIAALAGVLYFFFIFGGWMPASEAGAAIGGPWLRAGRMAGPLVLALLASWWWLWGGHRRGLVLTPAETHLLLTAPLTRAQIIRFKILHAQPAILFSAAIGSVLMRGTPLPWPLRLLSLWLLLATLHQHQIAASMVHAAAEQHGRHGLRRNLVPILLFGAAFGALVWALLRAVADIRANASLEFAAQRLIALLAEPAPRLALAPFRLLLAPTLASGPSDWLLPFGGACIVLLLHYVWLQRTDTAFEEAAAEEGERRDARLRAMRAGGAGRMRPARHDRTTTVSRPWLSLAPTGRNAYAIFWKNVLYAQRSLRAVRGMLLLIFIVMVAAWSADGGTSGRDILRFSAGAFLTLGGMITLFGPLGMRNDLRLDLRYIEQLRTYPLRSRELAAAEVAAATLTLTVPQLLLVSAGIALFSSLGALQPGHAILALAGAALVLPVINALAVIIQNLLVLLYPSWVRLGGHEAGGMETVGQNVIVMIGTMLLLVILAVPPFLVGALVAAPLVVLLGETGVMAGAAAAVIAAIAEAALLVVWLGRLYDRTDPVTAGLLH
ncbi:MAG TPA: putative ABC exporter domain-containing protein [Longimicrobiales bacterium]